jgi:hypothetical protein
MKLFLTKSLAFYLGCLGCFALQREGQLSPVLSAALVGLVGSFIHLPALYERSGLHAAIYAGAFAGMSSDSILKGHLDVLVLSLIGALLFILARPFGKGVGGRLGVISLTASLIYFVVRSI